MFFEDMAVASQPAHRPNPLTGGWQPVGTVQALRYRVTKEPAPRAASKLQARANYGLVSDRHACPHSPRQLLVGSTLAYERYSLAPMTLRENVLVDFATDELRSGDLLRIGQDVVLWLTFTCEPCSLLDRRAPGIAKTIGKHRGMLARVLRGGSLSVGDEVFVGASGLRKLDEDWRARVFEVVKAIPPGHFITYGQLAEMAGVATAYCRAFPRLVSKLPPNMSGRVGSRSSSDCVRWNGDGLYHVDVSTVPDFP